ncbi:hypothetical protein CHUAL_003275 [Chamberlinius hualienensis]
MLIGGLFVEHFGHPKSCHFEINCDKFVHLSVDDCYDSNNNVAPNFGSPNYLEDQISRLVMSEVEVSVCAYPRRRAQPSDGSNCVSTTDGPNRHPRVVTATTTVTINTKWVIDGADDRMCPSKIESDKTEIKSTDDLTCLRNCVLRLENSGFYYGQLSWQEASKLLKSTQVGTYLVRNSSDPAYLFALSVQTECGPTSIRIHYANGLFKLDAEDIIQGDMPRFNCVVKLIDYYARYNNGDESTSGCRLVWLDGSGRRDRVVVIKKPLYNQVRSLQHLCRISVNKNQTLQRIQGHVLPKTLQTFVTEYPYTQ